MGENPIETKSPRKIVLAVQFIEEMKSIVAESDDPLATLTDVGRLLESLASGEPPPDFQDRPLNPDDPEDAEVLEHIEQESGGETLEFASAEQAIAYLKKECGFAH